MKDKHLKRRGGAHIGDVLESFTANQLAWIGAVTIAYNEAEAVLHRLLDACIDYPGSYYDVSSRINGVDGLREIVMSAVKKFGLTAETLSSGATPTGGALAIARGAARPPPTAPGRRVSSVCI